MRAQNVQLQQQVLQQSQFLDELQLQEVKYKENIQKNGKKSSGKLK